MSTPHIPRELRKTYQQARRQDWHIRQGGRNHTLWYSPDGETIITVPSSPSDHRSLRNSLAMLRAAGLERSR